MYYNEGSGEAYKSSKKMLTICLEEKMTQDKIKSFKFIDEKRKAMEKSKHRSILLLK